MKKIWLLYDRSDLDLNMDYAAMMKGLGADRGMAIEAVTLDEITLAMSGKGEPFLLRNGKQARPDAVLSRMRFSLYSHHLEAMDVPVFNNAKVCELCNDKRRTHLFLTGLPMPESRFVIEGLPPPEDYPVVVKPACSHGGDRVTLVQSREQWLAAIDGVLPDAALEQAVVSRAGKDLRVYVVFGEIVAAVMRTAKNGVVSNYKQGGSIALHTLTSNEEALVKQVLERFDGANAPLCLAGIDLLYDGQGPVVGEVEDVVGSRMLYQVSDIDIAAVFLDRLISTL